MTDPGVLATMDQACALFRDAALALAETAHRLAEKFGEVQGTADVVALLVHQRRNDPNIHHLAALAAAALMALGKTDAWKEIYENKDTP